MTYILETERLQLREFCVKDADFILELLNSEGWLRFIGDRNIKTQEQAINYLENSLIKNYKETGFGILLVERKNDQVAVGTCGLLKRKELDNPDIGFAFLPQFQGQGYAYEIAKATLGYAQNTLKINKISAITLPENQKSILLLEKIGLTFDRTIFMPHSQEELSLYEIRF